jgi:hypothetical protein
MIALDASSTAGRFLFGWGNQSKVRILGQLMMVKEPDITNRS